VVVVAPTKLRAIPTTAKTVAVLSSTSELPAIRDLEVTSYPISIDDIFVVVLMSVVIGIVKCNC
jgi:hypothetical protein